MKLIRRQSRISSDQSMAVAAARQSPNHGREYAARDQNAIHFILAH